MLTTLNLVLNGSYGERDIINWRSGSSISTPTVFEGKLQQIPLISKSLLDKLEVVLNHHSKKKEIARRIQVFNDHIRKIFENQSRLRENIKSLEKILDSDLVRRYLKDLDTQEDDLNNTRKKNICLSRRRSKNRRTN